MTCLVLVLVLGGCAEAGREEGEPARSDPAAMRALTTALERTVAEKTARTELTLRNPDHEVVSTVEGVSRLDRTTRRVTVAYFNEPDIPPGTKLDMFVEGKRIFGREPDTGNWVEIPNPTSSVLGGLGDTLRFLGGTIEQTRRVGTSSLRGERVTRYEALVDLERVGAKLTKGQEELYRRTVEVLRDPRLPMEVSLDRAGRIRAMQLAFEPAGATTGAVTIDAEYYDFGVPGPSAPAIAR